MSFYISHKHFFWQNLCTGFKVFVLVTLAIFGMDHYREHLCFTNTSWLIYDRHIFLWHACIYDSSAEHCLKHIWYNALMLYLKEQRLHLIDNFILIQLFMRFIHVNIQSHEDMNSNQDTLSIIEYTYCRIFKNSFKNLQSWHGSVNFHCNFNSECCLFNTSLYIYLANCYNAC